jgi:hypothetical protein
MRDFKTTKNSIWWVVDEMSLEGWHEFNELNILLLGHSPGHERYSTQQIQNEPSISA